MKDDMIRSISWSCGGAVLAMFTEDGLGTPTVLNIADSFASIRSTSLAMAMKNVGEQDGADNAGTRRNDLSLPAANWGI